MHTLPHGKIIIIWLRFGHHNTHKYVLKACNVRIEKKNGKKLGKK